MPSKSYTCPHGLIHGLPCPQCSGQPAAGLREELAKVLDLCTVSGFIPADDEGPNRIGYMVGRKDDGKSGLYTTPERAFSKAFPNLAALSTPSQGPATPIIEPDMVDCPNDDCHHGQVEDPARPNAYGPGEGAWMHCPACEGEAEMTRADAEAWKKRQASQAHPVPAAPAATVDGKPNKVGFFWWREKETAPWEPARTWTDYDGSLTFFTTADSESNKPMEIGQWGPEIPPLAAHPPLDVNGPQSPAKP